MRKKIMSLLLCASFLCVTPQKAQASPLSDPHTIKQVALIVASLGITCGGTYLLSKSSKGVLNKIFSLIGGSTMVITGLAGIVLSDVILDNIQAALKRAAESSSS